MESEMFKIEKGIPIPKKRFKWIELAKKMEIGDSIFLATFSNYNGLRFAMDRLGFKWQTVKEGTGRRLWRIK